MKPWITKEWKEKREEIIKNKNCEWCGSKNNLVIHHPQPTNSLTEEQYMSLEGTIIICNRCHHAHHKGMVLCNNCKKHYHKPKFEMCFHCFSTTEKGKK